MITPMMLDVSITGMHVGAMVFHMFMISIFFGSLALAISAWSGSTGLASGVTAGVMLISFIGAGLFPIIEGYENVAKAFPWYYFTGSQPVTNGIAWGHIGVLFAGIVVLSVAALIGLKRRDLKGQTVGVSVLDRLRSNPMTQKITDRLAGSTRVSRVWIKTASEHQGLLLVTGAAMFYMGILIGPLYNLMDEALLSMADAFPEVILALFGGGDMSTPEGFYQIELFGMMAPIAVMVATVTIGARSLAGEEERRTMGLLLANPIKRSTIVLEKTAAMVIHASVVGLATFAGIAGGSLLGGLDISLSNIAATSLLVTLVGLAFGAVALALSAGSGRVRLAIYGTVGMALVTYVINALLPFSDALAGYAKWSPFYYYLGSDPLMNGMHWGHAGVLIGLTTGLVVSAVALFDRRDLRQAG
jgi:ABC-2 type transport system permease protein